MKKISVHTGFDELIQSDPEILDCQQDTDFFLTLSWFKNLAKTASPENYSQCIYSLHRTKADTAGYAICPMWVHYSAIFGWPVRRLLSMASFYTSLYRPFATSSSHDVVQDIPDLIAAMTMAGSRWDTIDFHPMDPEHPSFNAIRSALIQAGMATQTYFCFGNWYLKVNGRSFEHYFDGLPSQLKNTIIRKTKQLEKQQQLTIKISQKETDLGEALSAYEQVYQASWKAAEGFPAFIPGLVTSCAQQGWLRLGIAYINQQAVAAQIWIVCNKTASIYKLAYDERYAQFSIGSILTARVMQHVMDIDQVTEVDYLTGDDAYKRNWMSDRRERWGIMAFNLRTCAGLLFAIRHLAGHFIQSRIRFIRNLFRSGN